MGRNTHTWKPPYGWDYLRWTSLTLNPSQLHVLEALERQRCRMGFIRMYVNEHHFSNHISEFLLDYLSWLSTRIYPQADTLLLDQSIRMARRNSRRIPRCKPLNSYYPAWTRGHSASQLLLLNADFYGHAWYSDVTGQLRRHLFPAIPDAPGTAIIIHGVVDIFSNLMFAGEFRDAARARYGPRWLTVDLDPGALQLIATRQTINSPQEPPLLPQPLLPLLPPGYPIYKNYPTYTSYPPVTPLKIPLHLAAAAAA